MTGSKANNGLLAGLFPRLEHRGQPLAPHWLFYRRLSINFALGLAFILVSLAAGMLGYRYLEGLSWLRSFGHAAMILGGMGPYGLSPTVMASKMFEGIYAIYCGLLLIGVTGLILAPVFHRVMHQLHLPDDDDAAQRSSSEAVAHEKTDKPKPKPRQKQSQRRSIQFSSPQRGEGFPPRSCARRSRAAHAQVAWREG